MDSLLNWVTARWVIRFGQLLLEGFQEEFFIFVAFLDIQSMTIKRITSTKILPFGINLKMIILASIANDLLHIR